MSTNRYLEFDSSYRNRTLYPFPSDFVVEISQTGQADAKNAKDPISYASPILVWNNSFQEKAESNTTTALTVDTTFSPTDPSILKITSADGGIRYLDDFYNGAVLRITVAAVSVLRRVVDYEYLGQTAGSVENAILTLDSALPTGAISTDGVIENPTPIPTNTASAVIKFFIPISEAITNYYNNYYVQLVSGSGLTASYRLITYFDPITHLATLSSATPEDWSASSLADANFVIRKNLVTSTGTLLAVSSTGLVLQLGTGASSNSGEYIASFVRMIEPVPTTAGYSTVVAPYSEERRIANYIAGDGTFTAIAAGGSTFTLGLTASTTDDTYVGCFLTDTTTGDDLIVLTYTGRTRSGTVSGTWGGGAAAGDTWAIRTAFLSNKFSISPSVGGADNYEIEKYSRDNATPFEYKGSLVSSQQEVCYELELLNLILPNRSLISGRGGRPIFYPYLYVELEQISAAGKGSQEGIIYSNNPNANKMMFRAVLDDTTQQIVSPFIKIDGDGMVHVVKFKPNDSFKFAVFDPHGNLFKTSLQDFYSPTEPNPLVQISACFAFKRL